jgi:hypothetical protein
VRGIKIWLFTGLALGLIFVAVLHDTNIIGKIAGKPLPPKPDPLTRARAYDAMAEMVNNARTKLAADGKPVFVIANHYGITGELSFYLSEAKTNVMSNPLVYAITSDRPVNQYYFWPSYVDNRKGENAIFIQEISMPSLVHGWIRKWLSGASEAELSSQEPEAKPAPPKLLEQFESVQDLGLFYVQYRGRTFHIIQLFECRNLR